MAGTRISRQKLNNALKELPVPVQEHCKRCRMIANFLVEKVNAEDWFLDAKLNIDSILFAVSMHDVGKLQLPKDALYDDLTSENVGNTVYRSHAEEGVNQINNLCGTNLEAFGDKSPEKYLYHAVIEHHERVDGTGFPRGLKGKEISIVGKITAIANAVDNIFFVGATETRDITVGIEQLLQMAGKSLDYDLVEAMVSDRETFAGFVEFINNKLKNKRKNDTYGLRFHFYPLQNIRDNEPMAWCGEYVINDPYYGIVKAETFMPVAESSNLAAKLSKLALERICLMLDKIAFEYDEHPLISVNLSAQPLSQKTYVKELCKLIEKYEIKKQTICLVFDEGTFIGDGIENASKLAELRQAGYRVAISTSGDGATLLTSLDRIPVDYLFLNRRLTARIPTNPNTYGMASGILDMAHNLHISVVFLGVDERAIENELLKMRAKYACGELYGRALSEKELVFSIGNDGGDA